MRRQVNKAPPPNKLYRNCPNCTTTQPTPVITDANAKTNLKVNRIMHKMRQLCKFRCWFCIAISQLFQVPHLPPSMATRANQIWLFCRHHKRLRHCWGLQCKKSLYLQEHGRHMEHHSRRHHRARAKVVCK